MTRVTFGNHAAVVVPRAEQNRIRSFYRDVLGCELTRATEEKDDIRIGDDFYIAFLYEPDGVAMDDGGFLKAIYLELKTDDVDGLRQKIVAFGVKVLDMQDPHLYFQAPGGQVLRLVGLEEDLSKYEGSDHRELPTAFG